MSSGRAPSVSTPVPTSAFADACNQAATHADEPFPEVLRAEVAVLPSGALVHFAWAAHHFTQSDGYITAAGQEVRLQFFGGLHVAVELNCLSDAFRRPSEPACCAAGLAASHAHVLRRTGWGRQSHCDADGDAPTQPDIADAADAEALPQPDAATAVVPPGTDNEAHLPSHAALAGAAATAARSRGQACVRRRRGRCGNSCGEPRAACAVASASLTTSACMT